MKFLNEFERNSHPQASLIPPLLWKDVSFFNCELTDELLPLMKANDDMLLGLLKNHPELTRLKECAWLAIALSHPNLNNKHLVLLADNLTLNKDTLFNVAVTWGNTQFFSHILTKYSTSEALIKIAANDYLAFRLAAYHGHLDGINLLLKKVSPAGSFISRLFKKEIPDNATAMIAANNYEAIRMAAQNGHFDVIYRLIEILPDNAPAMTQVFKSLIQADIIGAEYKDLYQAVITNIRYADDMLPVFKSLIKTGIVGSGHKDLYQEVITSIRYANDMIQVFKIFIQADMADAENKDLYQAVITNILYSADLIRVFKILIQAGITGADHKDLYQSVITNIRYIDDMIQVFESLIPVNITGPEHKDLYQAVIATSHYAENIIPIFKVLIQAGITGAKHKDLYQAVMTTMGDANEMDNIRFSDEITRAFENLIQAGITGAEHKVLYQAIIANSRNANNIIQAFEELIQEGITGTEYLGLYQAIITSACDAYNLTQTLKKLIQAGITLAKHQDLYQILFFAISKEITLVLLVIEKIQEQFTEAKEIKFIIKLFLEYISSPDHQAHITIALLNALIIHMKSNNNLFQKTIEELFEKVKTPDITYGPLNKNKDTIVFEDLLQRITKIDDCSKITLSFEEVHGYTITLPDEPPINLTLLLRCANLSHLTLDDILIDKLGNIMTKLFPPSDFAPSPFIYEGAINQLPASSQQAIRYYTGNGKYYNMNRLFRGEAFSEHERHIWLNPSNSSNNMLLNFICGTLLNDAANKLICLPWSAEKTLVHRVVQAHQINKNAYITDGQFIDIKEIFTTKTLYQLFLQKNLNDKIINQNDYDILIQCFDKLPSLYQIDNGSLDRGEIVSDELHKRRLANALSAPSVTSFSVFKVGYIVFQRFAYTHTKIRGNFANYPVINMREGEILIAHGNRFRFFSNPQGGYFSVVVNSPDYEKSTSYWATLALKQSYEQHLSRDYQDTNHTITIKERKITRPNHGLAHTYRVMLYLPLVIDYFATHALEDGFKTFCQTITPEECDWLYAAAAFSVSGRESEISVCENPGRYNQFREASAHHFQIFLTQYPYKNTDLGKCYIESMPMLPEDCSKYKGRYIFCTNDKNKQLYYITQNGHHALITISDMSQFEINLQKLLNSTSLPLFTYKQIHDLLITCGAEAHKEHKLQSEPAMIERMIDVVRWMGNPNYEQARDKKGSAINKHPDENERLYRNYLHRLLDVAHQLDLCRCFTPAQYSNQMNIARNLSNQENPDQKTDYDQLIRYAVDLNKAHGNALQTGISWEGDLVSEQKKYKEPFDETSTSIKRVAEISEIVPRPQITRVGQELLITPF